MTLAGSIIALAGVALLLVTFAGLIARGRWSSWYAFTAYLLVVAGFSLTFVVYPPAYDHAGWLLQTNVLGVLRFVVALELATRTFRSFPGARSTLRSVLLCVVTVTLVVVISSSSSTPTYESFLTDVQPRLLNGTVWMFTAIAALILWYRLPVAPLHKSILLGYVPYLLFDAIFLSAFVQKGWDHDVIAYVNQSIYLLLVSHWAWVAWRAEVQSPTIRPGPRDEPDSGAHSLARVAAG